MIASSVPPLPCESPDSNMEVEPTQEKSLTSQSNQENSVDNEPSSSASRISRDASDQGYTSSSTLKRQSRKTQDEENSVPKKLNASKQIPDAVLANRYTKSLQGPYEIVVTSIGSVNSSIHFLTVGRLLSSTLKKDITEIKKLGFSKVSVQFKSREAANNIINNPILNSNNLIAYIPSYRVSRQGVIRNVPLDLAENTIKEEIDSSVGIISVRRLSRKIIDPSTRSVSYSPSKSIAITFEGQTVPQFLYLYMVRCLRMNTALFEDLLNKVTPLIQKQNTILRESISPAERLSLTLRHLATGESQESLRLTYRIGQSIISGIIKEVCVAIFYVLREEYLKVPSCENEWKVVANDFGQRWNFYNCIGAMDGKHFKIDPPLQSGSLYYNYKDSFSVVLLAIVDAHLRFIYVDVGTNGRISDSGIWNKCTIKAHPKENTLKIPGAAPLPNIEKEFPFVLIEDEGFPLSTELLIPYPRDLCSGRKNKRIFNYRLSRARRCSENAFGILGARFQIFRSAMRYDPDDASNIILACCCIHNMLRTEVVGRHMYTPPEFLDKEDELMYRFHPGEWRQEPTFGMINLFNQGGNRHANAALQLRDEWCDYFNGVGAVPWQERMVDGYRF